MLRTDPWHLFLPTQRGRFLRWGPFPHGFVLIELIFSTAILLILTGAFSALTVFLNQDYQEQVALAETQQEARVALSLFSNEIQKTGLNPRGDAFVPGNRTKQQVPILGPTGCTKGPQSVHPILEASETVFHLMGDLNGSGRFHREEDEGEDVLYEWVGEKGIDRCGKKRTPYTLYRDTGGGKQEVALGIVAFLLTYYDENGQKLPAGMFNESERDKIRKVVLTLRTVTKEGAKQREFSSELFLKNIG